VTITETAPVGESVSNRGVVTPPEAPALPTASQGGLLPAGPGLRSIDPRGLVLLVLVGILVLLVAAAVVIYTIGPLKHSRDQSSLMATERSAINNAAHDNQGLYRAQLPTVPPVPGAVLGIVVIPAIGLQEAVVEGVTSGLTVGGPGHVPGTAGLGQPGNAAVVGRRAGYGGPFARLGQLRPGERIATATTEGQSVYIVRSVRTVNLVTPSTTASSTTSGVGSPSPTTSSARTTTTKLPTIHQETTTALYGPSSHDQLTLVTSASLEPWNTDRAVVVVARLQGKPFTPTPQESRSPNQQGNTGESGALAELVLALLILAGTLVAAVALYRRASTRSAYLLTTAPLLAFTVLAAESASRILPAWL
jgi:sortase A